MLFICVQTSLYIYLGHLLVQLVYCLCVLSTHLSYYYVTFIDILVCVTNKFDLI